MILYLYKSRKTFIYWFMLSKLVSTQTNNNKYNYKQFRLKVNLLTKINKIELMQSESTGNDQRISLSLDRGNRLFYTLTHVT